MRQSPNLPLRLCFSRKLDKGQDLAKRAPCNQNQYFLCKIHSGNPNCSSVEMLEPSKRPRHPSFFAQMARIASAKQRNESKNREFRNTKMEWHAACEDESAMKINTRPSAFRTFHGNLSGKIGWAILWLLGVPLPVLGIFFLLRGCK